MLYTNVLSIVDHVTNSQLYLASHVVRTLQHERLAVAASEGGLRCIVLLSESRVCVLTAPDHRVSLRLELRVRQSRVGGVAVQTRGSGGKAGTATMQERPLSK